MKGFILFIVSFTLFGVTSFSQWTIQNSPVPGMVHGISFPDSLIGYINDRAGNISKTTDGGTTWSPHHNFTSLITHYPYFITPEKGFLCAYNGKIFRTTTGGDFWETIQLNTNYPLFKMSFPTDQIGYVIGDAGFTAKTTDGGLTWISLPSPTDQDLRSVTFIDKNIGWIGGTYVLYKTTDGGLNWVRFSGINSGTVREICFPTNNIGYVVGDFGMIYKTNNGGLQWTPQSSPTSSTLNYAYFLNADRGYAIGNFGAIISTTNGGVTWLSQVSGTNHHFVAAYFKNAAVGYCAGGTGGSTTNIFLKTINGGFPAPAVHLTVPNGGEKWITNSTQQIKWTSQMVTYLNIDYTTNNGESWISIATNYPANLNTYSWVIPATASANCRIRIVDTSNPLLRDSSDNPFSIISITVTSPNGGESWQVLSNHNISWQSTNVANVDIDFTTNNGTSWSNIVQGYNNSGSYSWAVPNISSNNCKVRVSEVGNTGNFDISNSTFSITPENIKAKITADTLYFDIQFNGYVDKQISGSGSTGANLTYQWFINDSITHQVVSPTVRLYTGINKIKLTITGLSGAVSSDSVFSNIFASKNVTGGAILSGVSQYNSHFYITSADKAVYEIDSLGNKVKTFLTGGSIQSLLTISQSGKLFTGSTDTRIYAFDSELIPFWDKSTGGIVKYAPALSSDGSTLYAVTSTGNVIAFDALSGAVKWGFSTEGTVTSSPVVLLDPDNKNIVYTGTSHGYLYAIKDNGSSGELFWRKELLDTIYSSIAVYPNGQNSLLFTASKGGFLYRFKWDGTFEENWKLNLNSPIYSSPVIDGNNLVYIGTKSGQFYGYSIDFTSSSTPLYNYYLGGGVIGTPAIGENGSIYIGTEKGYLFSLDKGDTTLDLRWKANLYSPIVSSALATTSGLIYAGTQKGDVFVMKEYLQTASLNKVIWPTYKGDNLRSKVISLNLTGADEKNPVVTEYQLSQNYPNPFNPTTNIRYQVPVDSKVMIEVFNITGERIAQLVNDHKAQGSYSVVFGKGLSLSSGIYFYRMTAVSSVDGRVYSDVKKLIMLK